MRLPGAVETELQAPNSFMPVLEKAFARYLARGRLTGMSPSRRHECRKIRWLPKSVRTVQRAGGACVAPRRMWAACVRSTPRGRGQRRLHARCVLPPSTPRQDPLPGGPRRGRGTRSVDSAGLLVEDHAVELHHLCAAEMKWGEPIQLRWQHITGGPSTGGPSTRGRQHDTARGADVC